MEEHSPLLEHDDEEVRSCYSRKFQATLHQGVRWVLRVKTYVVTVPDVAAD